MKAAKSLTVTNKLKPFTKNLMSLITGLEKVMVDVAVSLPRIEEEVDDNLLEARELMKFIFSASGDGTNYGIKFGLDNFKDHLEEAMTLLGAIEASDKKLFADLSESINSSSDILESLQEILTVSENLKVFAINSIVHSRNIGGKGRGYQIIAAEFIRLSEQIGEGTGQIIEIGKDLEDLINHDLLPRLQDHEDFSSTAIRSLTKDAAEIIRNANMSVDNFAKVLEDLLSRIAGLKEPFRAIMVDLQKQDIIQQQLIHLNDSFDDILKVVDSFSHHADSERSLLTLIKVLVVNAESQMSRIGEEINELVGGLEAHFKIISETILDIKQDKDYFSEVVIQKNGESQNESIVERIFHVPKDMIVKLRKNLTYIYDQKQQVLLSFKQIVSKMTEENDSAQSFPVIIRMINNLLTLARIERARYQLNISDLGDSSGEFHKSISTFSNIVQKIAESNDLVAASYSESEEIFTSQLDQYKEINGSLSSSLEFISKTEELFTENYETIINISDVLLEEVNQYLHLFDKVRSHQRELSQDIVICGEIRGSVQERLEQLGGEVPFEEFQYKDVVLQKIVKKCTVDQERETLMKEFSSLEIEKSSNQNITLF